MTQQLIWCTFPDVTENKKKKKDARPIFDAIRKPIAPPSRKFGNPKPEEKANPSLRKIKHKKKADLPDEQ